MVEVDENDLRFLLDAFDVVLQETGYDKLEEWLVEQGSTDEDLNGSLWRLGDTIGRDSGIL